MQSPAANIWVDPSFLLQVDAIVFLVDALDRERFFESKKELDSLLSDDGLATVPFLVLGNKIDVPQVCVLPCIGLGAEAEKAVVTHKPSQHGKCFL